MVKGFSTSASFGHCFCYENGFLSVKNVNLFDSNYLLFLFFWFQHLILRSLTILLLPFSCSSVFISYLIQAQFTLQSCQITHVYKHTRGKTHTHSPFHHLSDLIVFRACCLLDSKRELRQTLHPACEIQSHQSFLDSVWLSIVLKQRINIDQSWRINYLVES